MGVKTMYNRGRMNYFHFSNSQYLYWSLFGPTAIELKSVHIMYDYDWSNYYNFWTYVCDLGKLLVYKMRLYG